MPYTLNASLFDIASYYSAGLPVFAGSIVNPARVVRTVFLLEYLSNLELRRTIQGATNKSESFNQFVQWVAFGGGRLLAENTRDEQRKMIKYHQRCHQ